MDRTLDKRSDKINAEAKELLTKEDEDAIRRNLRHIEEEYQYKLKEANRIERKLRQKIVTLDGQIEALLGN